MTDVKFPLPHWQAAVSRLPPEVALACAINGSCPVSGYGLYPLADGGLVIGLREAFGRPSINPIINTYHDLVRLAVTRGCSDLPDARLQEACEFPSERGFLAFCRSSGAPVRLSREDCEEWADHLLDGLCQRWLEEADLFPDVDVPIRLLERLELGAIRSDDIEQDFIEACRSVLIDNIMADLHALLDAAADWCEVQRDRSLGIR